MSSRKTEQNDHPASPRPGGRMNKAFVNMEDTRTRSRSADSTRSDGKAPAKASKLNSQIVTEISTGEQSPRKTKYYRLRGGGPQSNAAPVHGSSSFADGFTAGRYSSRPAEDVRRVHIEDLALSDISEEIEKGQSSGRRKRSGDEDVTSMTKSFYSFDHLGLDHGIVLKQYFNRIPEYNERAPVRNLFRWRGTAAKLTFQSPDLYLLLGVHLICILCYHAEWPVSQEDWDSFTSTAAHGSTTFFIEAGFVIIVLAFYNSTAYLKYVAQYNGTRLMLSRLKALTMLLSAHYDVCPDKQNGLFRYSHAAHNMVYYGLNSLGDFRWRHLNETKLLSTYETKIVQDFLYEESGVAYELPLAWAFKVNQTAEEEGYVSVHTRKQLDKLLIQFNDAARTLYDHEQLPIPLAYYHMLNWLIYAFLLIAAIFWAGSSSYGIGYLLSCIFFLGWRWVTVVLAHPFGVNETDLPVHDFMTDILRTDKLLLGRRRNKEPQVKVPEGWVQATVGRHDGDHRSWVTSLRQSRSFRDGLTSSGGFASTPPNAAAPGGAHGGAHSLYHIPTAGISNLGQPTSSFGSSQGRPGGSDSAIDMHRSPNGKLDLVKFASYDEDSLRSSQ